MPEIVDDTVEEGRSHLMAGVAGAAAMGLGSAVLGPGLGMPLGATVAGAYIGSTAGTVLTVSGMAFGLQSLLFGNPFRTARTNSTSGSRGSM